MDNHIEEAFIRSMLEQVKQENLPLEPSNFQHDFLGLYTAKDFKLSLKESSFKKVFSSNDDLFR